MFMKPMLPSPCTHPLDDSIYLFEPKLDGHRLILSLIRRKVHMYTSHGFECTEQYPELCPVPVDDDVVLDGEVVLYDENGSMDHDALMERFRLTRRAAIRSEAYFRPVRYLVFDVLYYGGNDLRNEPLSKRKEMLDRILTENDYYRKVKYADGHGRELYSWIRAYRMPGLVAKRKDSVYEAGRSKAWLTINRPVWGSRDSRPAEVRPLDENRPLPRDLCG